MARESLRITGLRELQKSLKDIGAELPKMLRKALNTAAELVVTTGRPWVPTESGSAARSVRARSTGTAVRVAGGGKAAPYYAWLDFGGRVGRNRSVRRQFLPDGRYIYAAYYQRRDSGEFVDILTDALADVVKQAGLEVT